MSDEHAADPDTADDAESGDSLEPSGGPQRVVSEESVDDILASLDETTAESAGSDDATVTTSESDDAVTTTFDEDDAVTTTFDEDDVPAADETTDDSQSDTGAATATPTAERTTTESEPDADPADDTDAQSGTDSAAADTATVDATASSLPDNASLEDLAARVEEGTVTGADVRAAEAGEGRESTPEIDEVDLSLDDLETSGTGAGGTDGDADVPDDAGPLAGSIDRNAVPEASNDDGDSDDSPGLLGRLKNLFSR
ncbi:hypothetical protein E2L06_11260 [Haloterrigena sp. H1]|uniref:hypothetical protein n=1 Tax=Haloterrigena sp. H1 TaxID=2552943 RepID=UPI00110E4B39|nr:hypothetical protein [Haloterrigena sp. H1]TMT87128.1 hypothetical protein E2L06_11260 [Haloterrigena sp. H1]